MQQQDWHQVHNGQKTNTEQLPEGRKDYHSFSFSPGYLEELEPTERKEQTTPSIPVKYFNQR